MERGERSGPKRAWLDLERVPYVAGYWHAPIEQDAHRVKAEVVGFEVAFCEVLFCDGADRRSLAGGDRLERIAVSGAGSELDLHENERIGSFVQTFATPVLMFRALIRQDGTRKLTLARA